MLLSRLGASQLLFFFFSSRRRHTRSLRDWSSDVCSSDLVVRRSCTSRGYGRNTTPATTGPSSASPTATTSKPSATGPGRARPAGVVCDDAEVSEGRVEAGFQAIAAGDWPGAREAFSAVLEAAEVPEAFFGLATALFWLGDIAGTIANCEKAYAGFRRRPDPMFAAGAALALV